MKTDNNQGYFALIKHASNMELYRFSEESIDGFMATGTLPPKIIPPISALVKRDIAL